MKRENVRGKRMVMTEGEIKVGGEKEFARKKRNRMTATNGEWEIMILRDERREPETDWLTKRKDRERMIEIKNKREREREKMTYTKEKRENEGEERG